MSDKNSLQKGSGQDYFYDHRDFGGGYNSAAADILIKDNQLSGGQNVETTNIDGSLVKRKGHTLYGNYLGSHAQIADLMFHEPPGGTAELLAVFYTSVVRYVSGTWTSLTGVTMTAGLKADHAYFPLTGITYITNGTDSVVKYTSSSSGDQTDSSFKKGYYIVHYKNRLITANLTSQADYVWYTDLGVDTFSSDNYFRVEGAVTGLKVLNEKLLIFTARKIYVLQNFTFDGVAAGPEAVIPLPVEFGAVYQESVAKVGNLVYFLGQSAEGVAAVYVTDGHNARIISTDIAPDMENLAPTQLIYSAGTEWGRFYRLSVAVSGDTYNTTEYLYDTIARAWQPPYTSAIGSWACYTSSITNGKMELYAGSQLDGRVYKLNQVDYDEAIDQSLTSGQDTNNAVDANPAKRMAQSFQLSSSAPRTMTVTGVSVLMDKNAGTTTDLTVRIETDSGGVPSGTLADANLTGTITAFTNASLIWKTVKFTNAAALSSGTTYWLVVKHTTEGSGNSQYYWTSDASSPAYTKPSAAYASGTWTADANAAMQFAVFTESPIEAYADTKAFYLAPQGQQAHLRDIHVTAAASGDWDVQLGVNKGQFEGFDYYDLNVASNGPIFGSTFTFGSSTLGGYRRTQKRISVNGKRAKTFKFRFRNQYDNEPFTIYAFRARYHILNKFK